jgi:hypothetical protein
MPISKTGRFTFQRQYSHWQINEARRQFHREQTQKYLSSGYDAMNALQSTFSNQIKGTADLTAQAALKRIQVATSLAMQAARGLNISV